MSHRSLFTSLIMFCVVLLAAACNGMPNTENDITTAEADNVVFQLSWIHSVTWAGFYSAESDGYYANENLNVEMKTVFDAEGNFINGIDEVVSGRAQFAIGEAGEILRAREAGKPVVAIAALYQRHPLVFLSLAEKNIIHPQDLIGKTVEVSPNSETMYEAFLRATGVDASQVTFVSRTDFTIDPLLNGNADVIDGWVVDEIPMMMQGGYEYNVIYPFDYGIDMYPNLIITSEDLIANNPQLIQRFINASLHGLEKVVEDPEHAAQLTHERDEAIELEEALEGFLQSVPLIRPTGSRLGAMQAEMWTLTDDIMLQQGLLNAPIAVDTAYTMQFVDGFHACTDC